MILKKTSHRFIALCVGLLFAHALSAQVFKVQTREFSPFLVPNNSTFNQAPLTGTKVQKDFDIINLTASNQDIIVRKTEILLNVISNVDKALASYCFGVNCHGAEVFADTVTFIPNQSVALEIDFIEASAPGNSLIRYQVINKNNPTEVLNIYMNYSGVLGIEKLGQKNANVFLYPNPAKEQLYLFQAFDQKNNLPLQITVKNMLGKVERMFTISNEEERSSALEIASLKSGIYMVEIKTANHEIYSQKLLIE